MTFNAQSATCLIRPELLLRFSVGLCLTAVLCTGGCNRAKNLEQSVFNSRIGFDASGCGKSGAHFSKQACVTPISQNRNIQEVLPSPLVKARLIPGVHVELSFAPDAPIDSFYELADVYGKKRPVTFVIPQRSQSYALEDFYQPGIQLLSAKTFSTAKLKDPVIINGKSTDAVNGKSPVAINWFGALYAAISAYVVNAESAEVKIALPWLAIGDSGAAAALSRKLVPQFSPALYEPLEVNFSFTDLSLDQWQAVLAQVTAADTQDKSAQQFFKIVRKFEESELAPLPQTSSTLGNASSGQGAALNGEVPDSYLRRNELLAPGDLLMVFAVKTLEVAAAPGAAGSPRPTSAAGSATAAGGASVPAVTSKNSAAPPGSSAGAKTVQELVQQSNERLGNEVETAEKSARHCLTTGTLVHGGFLVEKDLVFDSLPSGNGFLYRIGPFDQFLASAEILLYFTVNSEGVGERIIERPTSEKNAIGQKLCVLVLRKAADLPWPTVAVLLASGQTKLGKVASKIKLIETRVPLPVTFRSVNPDNRENIAPYSELDLRQMKFMELR